VSAVIELRGGPIDGRRIEIQDHVRAIVVGDPLVGRYSPAARPIGRDGVWQIWDWTDEPVEQDDEGSGMSEDFTQGDFEVLVDILRHLHNLPGLDQIVETVCENRGVEIDWAATPADQEGGGPVGDHG
jgi:hypothetical protein